MRNTLEGLFLSTALLVLTGCTSVVGRWTLQSVTPEEAKKRYAVDQVVLRQDGSYWAVADKDGQNETSTGRYTFANNKLAFASSDGKTRTYDAKLVGMGDKLEIKSSYQGQDVTTIMKRCGRCRGCCNSADKECCKCGKCPKCCKCGKPAAYGPKCTKVCCKKK